MGGEGDEGRLNRGRHDNSHIRLLRTYTLGAKVQIISRSIM